MGRLAAHHLIKTFALTAPFLVLPSCAQTTVKEDGTTQVVGFVSMTLAPAEDPGAFAGQITDIRSLGMHAYGTPGGSGFAVGWHRLTSGHLRNHAHVEGDLSTPH